MEFKTTDELNARLRENVNSEEAKLFFDNASKFNEELQKWVINFREKNELPIEFVISALEKLKFGLLYSNKLEQFKAIDEYYAGKNA